MATSPSSGVRRRAPPERVEVDFFTDPLCPWSWAMAPLAATLREDPALAFRSVMAGWLPSPARKGNDAAKQEWRDAAAKTGARIEVSYWDEPAPQTSLVAGAAVKAAEFQGSSKAEAYLAQVREAAFGRGEDVSSFDILVRVAERTELKAEVFRTDLGVGRYTVNDLFEALSNPIPVSEAMSEFGRRKMLRSWDAVAADVTNAERLGMSPPSFRVVHGKKDATLHGFVTEAQIRDAIR